MIAHQAYRFALDPSPRAARALASHVGARRFAFNWGLALVKERLEARKRGEPVEVPWTLPALRREWNRAKEAAAPWWRENSKEAYSSGLEGLASALKAWSDSKKGRRKGKKMGFPRFRKKGRGRESVGFTTGAIRVDDQSHVVLPRIGRVPLWERTFRCDACRFVLDRDENAARNLAALAAAVAGSGPETENARGRDVRPALVPAVPEEAGSRRRASA